jgi:SAM-dependent methyltransferase
MHPDAYAAVARLRTKPAFRVFEVGSLNINGSVRTLFPGAEYHGIDRVEGPDVDAVGDGATYVPPFEPDTIVCCEVLEHADQPKAIIEHLASVLARGGTLIVTCAGPGRAPHSGVDGGRLKNGEHYANIMPDDLAAWLDDAGLYEVKVEGGRGVEGARLARTDKPGDVYAAAVKP